jgi:putative oxidoreductase
MYLLDRIDSWSEKHHPKWIDLLRFLLGLLIFWKGLYFISNNKAAAEIVQFIGYGFYTMTAAHAIIGVHILGGLMIMLGLLTRLAVLFQIPVMICNIIFVIIPNGLMSLQSELELTLLITFLLLFFLVEGSGPVSLDAYIKKHPEE